MNVFKTMTVVTILIFTIMLISVKYRQANAATDMPVAADNGEELASDIDFSLSARYLSESWKSWALFDTETREPVFVSTMLPASTFKNLETEIGCLADNLYFEARGESLKGQLAVGLVTLNRTISTKFPNSICKVVFQKRKHQKTRKLVAQFSWTLDRYSNVPDFDSKSYKAIKLLARYMLDRDNALDDFTNGATHYHADYVSPYWASKLAKIASYDTHIFYK